MNDEAVAFPCKAWNSQSLPNLALSKSSADFLLQSGKRPRQREIIYQALNDFSRRRWAKNLGKGAPLLVLWVIRGGP